jgi:DNA-binding transcriptional regulator GbsR (MarR family)
MSKRASIKALKAVLDLLSSKALTRQELMDSTNISKTMIIMALKELRESKEIYICDYIMNDSRKVPVYRAGNKPDALYEPMTKQSYNRKKREPEYVVPKTIKHHELIQWIFECRNI